MEKAFTKTFLLKQRDDWRYRGANFHIASINCLKILFPNYLGNEFYLKRKVR